MRLKSHTRIALRGTYDLSRKKDLLALNQSVAAKIKKDEPVIAPAVPKNYPDSKKFVTEDCIAPPSIA